MNTTSSQNSAHRNDTVWIKTGSKAKVDGELYLSEYTNGFTGQKIRKDWRMTGQDWIIFDANGNVTGRAHSLTWAKYDAAGI
jgi:hypothetical protein